MQTLVKAGCFVVLLLSMIYFACFVWVTTQIEPPLEAWVRNQFILDLPSKGSGIEIKVVNRNTVVLTGSVDSAEIKKAAVQSAQKARRRSKRVDFRVVDAIQVRSKKNGK